MAGALGRTKTAIAHNAWWAGPPVLVSAVLTATSGFWVLLVYVVANVAGVFLSIDHRDDRPIRRRRWMKVLALVMLPSGFYGLVVTGGGPSISESASGASSNESIRNDSARGGPLPPTTHRGIG